MLENCKVAKFFPEGSQSQIILLIFVSNAALCLSNSRIFVEFVIGACVCHNEKLVFCPLKYTNYGGKGNEVTDVCLTEAPRCLALALKIST